MSQLSTIRLIATREIVERTRSRVFRLGTALTVLIVVASVIFPAIASNRDSTPVSTIGFVDPVSPPLQAAVSELGEQLGVHLLAVTVPSQPAGETALREKRLSVLVNNEAQVTTLVTPDPTVSNTATRVAEAVRATAGLYASLERSGLPAEAVLRATSEVPPPVQGLEPAPRRNSEGAAAATTGMILLFVFLTLYGAFILNGVIEEKSSRVVEVLLSCASPRDLLIGKVLGIGTVGTLQGLVLVAATLIARAATPGTGTSALTFPVIAYTVMWFLLGFAVFGWLYACAGALVSRSEDAQNLVFPLQLPLIGSYVVGLYSSMSGPNTLVTVMSMIPFTAPMTMLGRMAAQQVEWWEVLISAGLCVLTSYLVMKLAVTIFAGGILRSGQRVKVLDAWRNPAS